MERSLLVFLLLLALSIPALTVEGVKGSGDRSITRTGASRPPLNETGQCYKRVPYSSIHSSNVTNGTDRIDRVAPQGVKSGGGSRGWVTIVDCCDGFLRNVTTGKCEAHCEEGCFGGVCSGPNVCTCETGWYAEKGLCKPICTRPCQRDAYCFAPDVCVCKLGWEEVDGECKPICPGGCRNGDCVAPRVCRCKVGYVANDRTGCAPTCEGGCPNGECTAPGVCTCNQGYVNPPHETEACLPDCPNGCGGGGECVSPGVCSCGSGFVRDVNGACASECNDGCPNGHCVGRNQCQCNPGYGVDPSGNGGCVAICARPCLNGECTGPDTCTCKQGYAPDPRDPTGSTCVAGCPGGCVNGICSGPNLCLCKPGFVKDRSVKSGRRCVPRG